MADDGTPAITQSRIALVIGNADYRFGPKLANPLDDAADIASAFGRLGFNPVRLIKDASLKDQNNALADFSVLADQADMAVIYFAGHGMEVDGENFLLPVDAELDHVRRLRAETMRLSDVLDAVSGAKRFRMVILDACRDNPFRGRMRGIEGTRSMGRGLAMVEPQGNTLVAYAARHGTQAKDGKEGSHSPYALALLNHIETPNVDVRIIFGRIRDDVLRLTDEMQEPHIYGTMGGTEIYLKEIARLSGAVSTLESNELVRELKEERDWEKTQRTNTKQQYLEFIDAWKDGGRFVDEAKRKIKELDELADYAAASALKSADAWRDFLRKWPSGRKAAEASATLNAIEERAAFETLKPMLNLRWYDSKFDAAAMRSFVQRFAGSKHALEVLTKLASSEKEHASTLEKARFKAEFQLYLDKWPEGSKRAEVERWLSGGGDDRLWIEIQKSPEPWLIKRYLQDWPEGRHVAEAQALLPRRERHERWFEGMKIAAGGGVVLTALAIAASVLFFIATQYGSPVYDDWSKFDGTTVTWVRARIADCLKPVPPPPPLRVNVDDLIRQELQRKGVTTMEERQRYYPSEVAPGETAAEFLTRSTSATVPSLKSPFSQNIERWREFENAAKNNASKTSPGLGWSPPPDALNGQRLNLQDSVPNALNKQQGTSTLPKN